jgi:hypothetical protein
MTTTRARLLQLRPSTSMLSHLGRCKRLNRNILIIKKQTNIGYNSTLFAYGQTGSGGLDVPALCVGQWGGSVCGRLCVGQWGGLCVGLCVGLRVGLWGSVGVCVWVCGSV